MIAKIATVTNAGQSIELSAGEVLLVQLPETPTSGFRWEIEPVSGLALLSSSFQPGTSPTAGGGGNRIFELQLLQIGETHLRAKLWREWAGESSIRQRFELTLRAVR
jgi:inhibitor of cysteine peptidase